MSTFTKGADVEAMSRIAANIRAMQTELATIESTARSAMSSIEGNWGGDNLLSLVRTFNAEAVPGLRSCTHVLDQMARKLDENVRAQQSTSGPGDQGGSGGGGGGGSGGGGSGGGGSGGGGDATDPAAHDRTHNTDGKQHDWGGPEQDDSRDAGDGNRYTHRTLGGLHTYENSRTEDGRTRTDTYTHVGEAGDHNRPIGHEWSDKTETERQREHRVRLPTDDSDDPDSFANRHERASTLVNGAVEGVNWTEKDEHSASTYEPAVMYDENGNVTTDPAAAVRTVQGGWLGAEATVGSEVGIKDGALYAGAAASAGAYLAKGSVEGTLGEHGRYRADGFVGAEGKADAGVSLGKDGLQAKASAEAFVGAKGAAEVSGSYGVLDGHAGVNAMAGAEAKADASVGIGKDGLKAHAGGEAFAGVKAGAEVGGSVAGVGGAVGGEVYAGIGGHAKVDANFSAESVKVNVDVGAALGVGAGVKFSVDIRPEELMHDVGLVDAANVLEGGAKGVANAIGGLFG